MIYIGIDPGASGGIAWLRDGTATLRKMPASEQDILDVLAAIWQDREDFAPSEPMEVKHGLYAMLERVHAMPGQGVASTFKFGASFGALKMALTASRIPYDLVPPGVWQRAMGCLSKGDKRVTRNRAQQLFPGLKITHATADALLMAEYCRRKLSGILAAG